MKTCIYCGNHLNITRDHIIPVSFTSNSRHYEGKTVDCCSDCNSLLRNLLIIGINDRAKFLIKKYKNKYANILRSPDWSDKELQEIGENLRNSIVLLSEEKRELKRRLHHLKHVSLAKESTLLGL